MQQKVTFELIATAEINLGINWYFKPFILQDYKELKVALLASSGFVFEGVRKVGKYPKTKLIYKN